MKDLKEYKIDAAMRLFLTAPAIFIWIGIWLTGFNVAHWIFYIPAVFFTFAIITGICPGMIIAKLIIKK
jgi:hypothetical protein